MPRLRVSSSGWSSGLDMPAGKAAEDIFTGAVWMDGKATAPRCHQGRQCPEAERVWTTISLASRVRFVVR